MQQNSDRARDPVATGENAQAPAESFFRRLFSRTPKTVSVPAGVRVYAVGDIHGRLDLLDRIGEMIAGDSANGPSEKVIVYLGDYIDRGPESKGVVDRLLAPAPKGFQARYIKGNHDQSLLDFLANPSLYRMWRNYGAQETLVSYGVRPPLNDDEDAFADARDRLVDALPPAHLDFFTRLEYFAEIGDYFFVHAGVRPGLPLIRQSPEDMMWIRENFLTSNADFGKVVVHGHTPTPAPVKRSNRIGVDTGAYATGQLTCVVLEGEGSRFLHT